MTTKYDNILHNLYQNTDSEVSPRGMKVREILFHNSKWDTGTEVFLQSQHRNIPLKYAMAELIGFLSANNDTRFISHFGKFWGGITDDGKTATSAYGSIIGTNQKFGVVQYDEALEMLRKDPDTRKAVMHIKRPGNYDDKDMNCTIALQFIQRNGELHLFTTMRGNDVGLGLPYNYMMFKSLLILGAHDLGLEIGTYHHNVASMHIYEQHWGKVNELHPVTTYQPDIPLLREYADYIYQIVSASITYPGGPLLKDNLPFEVVSVIQLLTGSLEVEHFKKLMANR